MSFLSFKLLLISVLLALASHATIPCTVFRDGVEFLDNSEQVPGDDLLRHSLSSRLIRMYYDQVGVIEYDLSFTTSSTENIIFVG